MVNPTGSEKSGRARPRAPLSLPELSARIRIPGSGLPVAVLGELASGAESVGADAFFVDGERSGDDANDAFVVLAAAAASTSRLTLGCVASPLGERQPSILAKTLASLDLCSGGRAMACLAAGGQAPAAVGEAVTVIRAMLEAEAPTIHGEHYSVTRAWNEPRAVRDRPMPIGVALHAPAPTDAAGAIEFAGIVVALSDRVDFVVSNAAVGVGRLAPAATPQVLLLDADPISASADQVRAARAAGYAGVIVDFHDVPDPDAFRGAVRAARAAFDGQAPAG